MLVGRGDHPDRQILSPPKSIKGRLRLCHVVTAALSNFGPGGAVRIIKELSKQYLDLAPPRGHSAGSAAARAPIVKLV